jgi:hypothetical protein
MKKNELLLYQPNTFPSALALLFLVFNTFQAIFTLNTIDVSAAGIRVMEIILTNIVLSFFVFIAASEIKRYSFGWSWAALGIGIFQCLRFFFLPGSLHVEEVLLTIVFPLEAAGFLLITAACISLVKCRRYRIAKKELECRI